MDHLSRITDLFTEGAELFLGHDDSGKPVVIWVNKLNSFEVEEARRDGITRRGLRMATLAKEDNPERQVMAAEVALWGDDQLRENWTNQQGDEILLRAFDDLEAEEGWREKSDLIQRAPHLLADRGESDSEDPLMAEYLAALEERQQLITKFVEDRRREVLQQAKDMSRAELERSFFERWRQRLTVDEYVEEKRITELWIALRACDATRIPGAAGAIEWDHAACDHSRRLLGSDKAARGKVRSLPPEVIEKAINLLDEVTVSQRTAGNSDAPRSSSAPSEPSSASEAASTPSSLGETPDAAPMT